MEKEMENQLTTYIISDSIISSLGFGTEENLNLIRDYKSGLTVQQDGRISNSPLLAATISRERLHEQALTLGLCSYTHLEQLFILTISDVLQQRQVSLQDENCGLILSTTKGNIDKLSKHTEQLEDSVYLWKMAENIADYFNTGRRVHIISNACISGVSSLIVGKRLIESGTYKKVVVAGGDLLSHFITSGFSSFKSISEAPCRPYNIQRDGLNLGEACGAILLSSTGSDKDIILSGGAISNDANHISGPSRTGDGLYLAIHQAITESGIEPNAISFINAHGTATLYNDEMESKALSLAHLESVPLQSLKPYFGHTLGASGIIESIICLHELKTNQLFGTLGFQETGVSMPIKVSAKHQTLTMQHCLKTASGFGGCNAAIILSLPTYQQKANIPALPSVHIKNTVSIENNRIILNNQIIHQSEAENFGMFIREVYKLLGDSNMKFYKMDDLCKLGYIAAEYLLREVSFSPQEVGILLANSSSSLHTDLKHQRLIDQEGDMGASPAVFVYTLPNVVSGEICIRHKIKAENTFFINKEYNPEFLEEYARTVIRKGKLKYCITGWCELLEEQYKAEFNLFETL